MQFSFFLITSLLFITSSATKNPRTRNLQVRANVLVACQTGVFQNPDEDIRNVVCMDDSKCAGGSDASTQMEMDGKVVDVAECTGCPTQLSAIPNRCSFVEMMPATTTVL